MSVVTLNPVAVSSVVLLRAIRDGGWSTLTQLAEKADRKPNNITRDLSVLNKAGLLAEGATGAAGMAPALSDEALIQLDAIDRAEAGAEDAGKPGSPERVRFPEQVGDIRLITHAQIFPDHANARTDWDSEEAREELDALRADILQFGLLQNLVVRPDDFGDALKVTGPDGDTLPLFTLVGGERRWRAIGLAIAEDDWPRDRPIPCRVVNLDDLDRRLAALSENLQRRNLNPLEKALAFEGLAKALADNGVEDSKINREIADRVGVTIEHVQQHRSFMKLDEADQQRLTLPKDDARRLSVTDARKKVAAKASEPEPLLIDAMARLAWIELTDAAFRHGRWGNLWNSVVVAPDADLSPEGKLLIELGAIQFDGMNSYGDHIGRFTAKRGYDASKLRVSPAFPAAMLEGADARTACVRAEQVAILGDAAPEWPEGGVAYATPWLAEPGVITHEGQAHIDAAEERRRLNEAEHADRVARSEARNLRWSEARQRHLQLMETAQSRPDPGKPEEITDIATDLDRPLPWTLLPSGIVVAANAAIVRSREVHFSLEHDLAIGQMIVVAANAAANQATPAIPTQDDEDEPEQDIDGNDPDAEGDENDPAEEDD